MSESRQGVSGLEGRITLKDKILFGLAAASLVYSLGKIIYDTYSHGLSTAVYNFLNN